MQENIFDPWLGWESPRVGNDNPYQDDVLPEDPMDQRTMVSYRDRGLQALNMTGMTVYSHTCKVWSQSTGQVEELVQSRALFMNLFFLKQTHK